MWPRFDAFMSRLHGHLSSLRGIVLGGIFGILTGVLGNYVYDELSDPKAASLQLNMGELLRLSTLGIILLCVVSTYLLLGVLGFFAQQPHRRHEARRSFDLIEYATKLPPRHLGFRVMRPGGRVP